MQLLCCQKLSNKLFFIPRRLPIKQSGAFDFGSLGVDVFLQGKGTNLTQNSQPGGPGCLP